MRAELEAAKQEAKNMCSKENKRCCSKVIIIVSDSGDKNGKGAWQVKFTFGINPYTVTAISPNPEIAKPEEEWFPLNKSRCFKFILL